MIHLKRMLWGLLVLGMVIVVSYNPLIFVLIAFIVLAYLTGYAIQEKIDDRRKRNQTERKEK